MQFDDARAENRLLIAAVRPPPPGRHILVEGMEPPDLPISTFAVPRQLFLDVVFARGMRPDLADKGEWIDKLLERLQLHSARMALHHVDVRQVVVACRTAYRRLAHSHLEHRL